MTLPQEVRVPTIHGVMTLICFECGDSSKCMPFESDPLNPELKRLENPDIVAIFGKPYTGNSASPADPQNNCQISNLDASWEAQNIVFTPRIPILNNSQIRCHRMVAGLVYDIFSQIAEASTGCFEYRLSNSGAYYPRCIKHKDGTCGTSLSKHAWGVAFDLNDATNKQGSIGDMPAYIIRTFEENGFLWGGRWAGDTRDPMHFEWGLKATPRPGVRGWNP